MAELDITIYDYLYEHYEEALNKFGPEDFIGIFFYGAPKRLFIGADCDFYGKVLKMSSVAESEENTGIISNVFQSESGNVYIIEDINTYLDHLNDQSTNELNLLFVDYYFINPKYNELWNNLVENRELLVRLNPSLVLKDWNRIANNLFKHLQVNSDSINLQYASWILSLDEKASKYILNEPFEKCLVSDASSYLEKIESQEPPVNIMGLVQTALEHLMQIINKYKKTHYEHASLLEAENIISDVRKEIIDR